MIAMSPTPSTASTRPFSPNAPDSRLTSLATASAVMGLLSVRASTISSSWLAAVYLHISFLAGPAALGPRGSAADVGTPASTGLPSSSEASAGVR